MLISALIGAVAGWSYRGISTVKGIVKQQDKDAKAVLKISKKEKERIKYVYRTKVVLKKIQGQCLDTDIPDAFIGELRRNYSGT